MAVVEIHVHSNADLSEVNRKLDKLLALAKSIKREEVIMIQEMTDLIAEVNEVKTVQASATAAITALINKFNEAIQGATDLAEAKAAAILVTAELKEATAPLAAAVANVPA